MLTTLENRIFSEEATTGRSISPRIKGSKQKEKPAHQLKLSAVARPVVFMRHLPPAKKERIGKEREKRNQTPKHRELLYYEWIYETAPPFLIEDRHWEERDKRIQNCQRSQIRKVLKAYFFKLSRRCCKWKKKDRYVTTTSTTTCLYYTSG